MTCDVADNSIIAKNGDTSGYLTDMIVLGINFTCLNHPIFNSYLNL